MSLSVDDLTSTFLKYFRMESTLFHLIFLFFFHILNNFSNIFVLGLLPLFIEPIEATFINPTILPRILKLLLIIIETALLPPDFLYNKPRQRINFGDSSTLLLLHGLKMFLHRLIPYSTFLLQFFIFVIDPQLRRHTHTLITLRGVWEQCCWLI